MAYLMIEARSFNLGGIASHNFWVLRDQKTDEVISELHGLATERSTNTPVPVGTDDDLFSLRIWKFDNKPLSKTLIKPGQRAKTVFSGVSDEVLSRWGKAVSAMSVLNQLDRDYPAYGINIMRKTVNSNSAYQTLGQIMGVDVPRFPWVWEPGINNMMVTPDALDRLAT